MIALRVGQTIRVTEHQEGVVTGVTERSVFFTDKFGISRMMYTDYPNRTFEVLSEGRAEE